jgi:hypothetical protein
VTTTPKIRKTEGGQPAFITEKQSLGLLQISRATFRRMRAAGDVTTFSIFGTTMRRYRRSEIEALIRAEPIETTATTTHPLKAVR